jgi:hypothetical protein
MIDPDDVEGFAQLGLHGFDFDRHGDVVMSVLGPGGMVRALFCWRLDGPQLVLEEVATKSERRPRLELEGSDAFRLDGSRYLRRDDKVPIDAESGVFCIGSAGIRHALASIAFAAPDGVESFPPLLLLDGDGPLSAERIYSDDPLASARKRAKASTARRGAFVHDGSSQGTRAVVAVASERGAASGRTLLLRYRFENGAVALLPPLDSAPSENFW